MRKLIALIMFALLACSNNRNMNERKQVITNFLDFLKNEKEVTVDILHSKYFYQNKFSDTSKIGYHLLTLISIKESIKGESKIEVLSYYEAMRKKINVYTIENSSENVFLILVKESNNTSRNIYCLMHNNTIESLSVLRKGNLVIGWN